MAEHTEYLKRDILQKTRNILLAQIFSLVFLRLVCTPLAPGSNVVGAHLDVGDLEAVNVQSLHICVGLSILEKIKKESAGLLWESALQVQTPVSYTHLTLPTICSV